MTHRTMNATPLIGAVALAVATTIISGLAHGEPFDPRTDLATGPVILTVTGDIANAGPDGSVHLDRAMLESVGMATIETTTEWTQGVVTFDGVLARDLMALVGARGERVEAIALNDYSFTIELSDFSEGDVILAMDMNGQPMRVRDKGPIWIVYPDGDFDIGRQSVRAAMVWQLRTLRVE